MIMGTVKLSYFFILVHNLGYFYINAANDVPAINCQADQIKFEKVIGVRPSNHYQKLLLVEGDSDSDDGGAVTEECLKKCEENEECLSFVIFFNMTTCYWYKSEVHNDFQEEDSVLDMNTAWFVKTCLEVKNCTNSWIFERIPGATLVGNSTKKLPEAMTRRVCQQRCLNETDFICKSVKFRVLEALSRPTDTIGICILSDTNRHITPNAYRVSTYMDEYFENQCIKEETNAFCSYEEFDNVSLAHIDVIYANKSKLDCQNLCEKTSNFLCRGYTIIPTVPDKNNPLYTCHIHSEDSKVHGPRLLEETKNARYYEKAPCLNITVNCTESHITVSFQPEVKYGGRMYMQGYSENPECYVIGTGYGAVTLKVPLVARKCGIIQAKNTLNSTLLSSTMVLQYNSLVQTQADRIIKVGCIFGNESKILLGAGFNFTSGVTNTGSISINSSTAAPPKVELRVIDLGSQNEVSDTQIGQELQLIIELQSDGPYDIWAGHLIAMTENGQDSILLLDDRGCPTNLDVFPPLTKIVTNTTKQLVSTFQAFKFSSSNVIRFSVVVQFCMDKCPKIDCGNFFTKRKREIESADLVIKNETQITSVDRDDFERTGNEVVQEMPLQFQITVRSSKTNSDSLIYGESNRILVAGFDFATNEICLDYYLVIALIVTWILIQVIFFVSAIALIKKYKKYYRQQNVNESLEELHKNFEFGTAGSENRRVHFLDQ